MRFVHYLALVSCCIMVGCHSGETQIANHENAAQSVSLDPAELEKLPDWDATSKASAKLTEMLANIMSEIQDKESAEAAIPKLRLLAPKFAAVNRAEQAFGEPSKEEQTLVFKNLADSNKKFDNFYTPLMENEELKVIVSQAIDDAYVGKVTEE